VGFLRRGVIAACLKQAGKQPSLKERYASSAINSAKTAAKNSAVRSAVPENPTLEPNMKWIGSPVAEILPFAYGGGIWNPHFGERRGRRGSAMAPLERAMVVSYRLPIVTVALSV